MSNHVLDDVNNLTPKAIIEALERGEIKLDLEIGRIVYGEKEGQKVIESCVVTGVRIARASG